MSVKLQQILILPNHIMQLAKNIYLCPREVINRWGEFSTLSQKSWNFNWNYRHLL